MAITYSHYKPPISLHSLHQNPASISLNPLSSNCAPKASISAELFAGKRRIQISPIVAAIGDGGVCTPLEPTSSIGKSLCDVLMNDPYSFYDAVSSQLTDLAVDRDNAFGRMELSFGKPEACLHRRIAEMKEAEHSFIIENIMSMIIYKMFKDINVSPTPTIDKSTCKQNWETSSSNDDLKSIHSNEVIETIQGYLTSVLPINPDPIAITNMIALEIILIVNLLRLLPEVGFLKAPFGALHVHWRSSFK